MASTILTCCAFGLLTLVSRAPAPGLALGLEGSGGVHPSAEMVQVSNDGLLIFE
ncbi:MAG: hypothetical protein NZ602_00300 [Thermoguttaceae bacterium]|nr:hypothetical protein [Thermoguttaceae bacterium]MDW8038621.1 hypothetical protein [Thermoguttaceae bacterium]